MGITTADWYTFRSSPDVLASSEGSAPAVFLMKDK